MSIGIAQLHEIVDKAVAQIIKDLKSRQGLEQEWDAIDSEIQAEIARKWKTIIVKELTNNQEKD